MYGLIIKKKWIDLILSGKKTLEIRGSRTNKLNEPIYILESGTHRIRGIFTISQIYPISENLWKKEKNKHNVQLSYEDLLKIYKTPYAWELINIKEFTKELYYVHPKGAVIWVKDVIMNKN